MSARVRTTVSSTAIVALALAIATAGLLVGQRHAMVGHLDDVADVRASDVAALVNDGALPRSLSAATEDDDLVRVVADDGTLIASTPGYTTSGRRVTTAAADGATVYVATSLEPVDDALASLGRAIAIGGPLLLLLVAVMTWTMAGRALTRIEASADRQRRFVADASHELRTPLASVRTDLEVALEHPDATDWTAVAADVLATSAQMERLVNDLLFLARADAGALRPTQPVDVDDVVLEEVARTHAAIDTLAVSGAEVNGRRDDLARVVRNLLDNALRHASSRVAVAVVAERDGAVITVSDDGPGIPADERERIFERFNRVDGDRTRAGGGTGLGLAIAREIVVAHGGSIDLADGDVGSTFRVRLPSRA